MGTTITLNSPDGHAFSAYKAEPTGRPRGAIVVIQEIFGVNSHIRGLCDGFARDGYLAIAPALYDRAERGVDLGYGEADVARGREIRTRLDWADVMRDVQTARDEAAKAGKVGIVGYCWGGTVTWLAASRVSGLAAAAPYYGGGMGQLADEPIKVPTMCHFGAKDPMIPLSDVEKIRKAHPEAEVHVYDADHGFNCDQRHHYDAAAAKLARERTMALFAKHVAA